MISSRPRLVCALRTVATALWLLALHMLLLASSMPIVRHLQVHTKAWPAGASPMRLVLLSDLHVAIPGDSPTHLAHVISRVNALHPDLVLVAGDILSTDEWLAWAFGARAAAAPLAEVRAPLGTIAVLGNHDYSAVGSVRQEHVATALAAAGVTLLSNGATRRGPLAIVGIADADTSHDRETPALDQAHAIGGIPIVVTHSPDAIPKLPDGIDLALVGHTHCGQVVPPLIGPVATSSRFGLRYVCGIVREGSRTSITTAGLGTSELPIRLGASPDLWVIDIGR